jgi:hypothetical protein
MKLPIALILAAACVVAAEPPSQPIAKRGALIFSDDFSAPEVGKSWRALWPALSIVDGRLKIALVKPEHRAVGMFPLGTKVVVVEFKFQLGTATGINAVFNDKSYKEGHAGHLARVSLSPRQLFLADDKARLTHELEEMKKDPARRDELKKRTAGYSASVPMKIDPATWHTCAIELVNDEMRVSLDGAAVGYLKSPGIAHPTKSDFYFAVSGESQFDDVRAWKADASTSSK